jgi:hypothetical protein
VNGLELCKEIALGTLAWVINATRCAHATSSANSERLIVALGELTTAHTELGVQSRSEQQGDRR